MVTLSRARWDFVKKNGGIIINLVREQIPKIFSRTLDKLQISELDTRVEEIFRDGTSVRILFHVEMHPYLWGYIKRKGFLDSLDFSMFEKTFYKRPNGSEWFEIKTNLGEVDKVVTYRFYLDHCQVDPDAAYRDGEVIFSVVIYGEITDIRETFENRSAYRDE